jgi:hypothetical protein
MAQMVQDAPDQQVSLTDPDARSMATCDCRSDSPQKRRLNIPQV